MSQTELLTVREWDDVVDDYNGILNNGWIEDGRYCADFYLEFRPWQRLVGERRRKSLEAALHEHDLLKPVFVTVDVDHAYHGIFLTMHFPMDSQVEARLELAAKVVVAWRRKVGDTTLDSEDTLRKASQKVFSLLAPEQVNGDTYQRKE